MKEKIEVERELIRDCLFFAEKVKDKLDTIKIPFVNLKKSDDYDDLEELIKRLKCAMNAP